MQCLLHRVHEVCGKSVPESAVKGLSESQAFKLNARRHRFATINFADNRNSLNSDKFPQRAHMDHGFPTLDRSLNLAGKGSLSKHAARAFSLKALRRGGRAVFAFVCHERNEAVALVVNLEPKL